VKIGIAANTLGAAAQMATWNIPMREDKKMLMGGTTGVLGQQQHT